MSSVRSQEDVNLNITYNTNNNNNSARNNSSNLVNNNVSSNTSFTNNDRAGLIPNSSYQNRMNIPYSMHAGNQSDAYYSTTNMRESSIGAGPGIYEPDSRSIQSTPSRVSKFTYSEYPQIRPTNPLYTSTATIKTAASAVSRVSTANTVSRRQKYNPKMPRRIKDWRWVSSLALLLFFPTGIIAAGLAFKAQTKFDDGFIDDARKLNKRAFLLCLTSFFFAAFWIMLVFFMMDIWPRTNG